MGNKNATLAEQFFLEGGKFIYHICLKGLDAPRENEGGPHAEGKAEGMLLTWLGGESPYTLHHGYNLNNTIISMKKTGVFMKCFWTVGLLASTNEFFLRAIWGVKMPLYLRIFF